mmetsp:Transcript_45277/g.137929  ORF Transcript_45277/g.137929 Transcript_45277/m.137929 type:complete len:98 (-) Transcript_45277:9-302(-)
MLHVEGRGEAHGVAGEVVGEDDGAHGRLARVGLAHEKDLLLCHGLFGFLFAEDCRKISIPYCGGVLRRVEGTAAYLQVSVSMWLRAFRTVWIEELLR